MSFLRKCLALHLYKCCYRSARIKLLPKRIVDVTTVIFNTVLSCTELCTNVPNYKTEQKYPIPSRELNNIHKAHPLPIRHLVV